MSAPLIPPSSNPKWTYDDFVKEIALLKARVLLSENRLNDMELVLMQCHKGLCEMHAALSIALTSAPVKFTPQEQKAWEGKK